MAKNEAPKDAFAVEREQLAGVVEDLVGYWSLGGVLEALAAHSEEQRAWLASGGDPTRPADDRAESVRNFADARDQLRALAKRIGV